MRVNMMLFLTLFLFGCASSSANLQHATSRALNGYQPNDIAISDVNRGVYFVDWLATTSDGKKFKCNSDDMVRQVKCQK